MSGTRLRAAAALAIASAAGLATASGVNAATGVPDREADPVVLTGSNVPGLIGIQPGTLVAFSWDDGWKQIPVQVDERAMVNYSAVRKISSPAFSHEAYTDAKTFAGADPDPTLDAGDEIAMMAKDAGSPADDETSPAGVDSSTRTAVDISDPLEPGGNRMIYLFKTNSGLDSSAGKSYVDYDFSLNSGDYKTTYNFAGVANDGAGPPANPENSTVTTPFYSQHLLARWVADELSVKAGASTGADILDGDKAQVARGCGRSELTFSRGGGGFIVNRNGPIRAIRSYIGANSGTFTQREDIFYERRQDTFTFLRVHLGISQVSQYLDYSAAATGMTYRNSAYPAGVTIDGISDVSAIPIPPANGLQPATTWEQSTGPQGSLSVVTRADTDLPGYTAGSFYRDLGAGPFDYTQCGGYGDALSYGTSGSEFKSGGGNTDPTLAAPVYHLTAARSIFYDAPFASAAAATDRAVLRSAQVDSPLSAAGQTANEPDPAALKLGRVPPRKATKAGKKVKIKITVGNTGGATAHDIKICPSGRKHLVKIGGCKGSDALASGDELTKPFKVKLKRKAATKPSTKVLFTVSADGVEPSGRWVKLKIR